MNALGAMLYLHSAGALASPGATHFHEQTPPSLLKAIASQVTLDGDPARKMMQSWQLVGFSNMASDLPTLSDTALMPQPLQHKQSAFRAKGSRIKGPTFHYSPLHFAAMWEAELFGC